MCVLLTGLLESEKEGRGGWRPLSEDSQQGSLKQIFSETEIFWVSIRRDNDLLCSSLWVSMFVCISYVHVKGGTLKKITLAPNDIYSYFIDSQIILYNYIQMLLKPHYSAIISVFINVIFLFAFLLNILMDFSI